MSAILWLAVAALGADLHFEPWFVSEGVRVEIARPLSSPPWIRGTAEIAASSSQISGILVDYRRYSEVFAPALKRAVVLEERDGLTRMHLVWPYPFPLRNRDAVVGYRSRADPGGRFVLEWSAAPGPRDPHEGVRIERVSGETVVDPVGENLSRIVYTYLGDLGGHFPASAEDKAWRAEPVHYMKALRRRLNLPEGATESPRR